MQAMAARFPVPKAQSPLQKVVYCILHQPVMSLYKAPLLFVVVIIGSTLDALDMSSKTPFSDVRNPVNQYFVKFTWGWSLLVLPTVLIMSVLYTTAMDWKTVAKHMVHLTVAHIIWYLVTTFFVVVNIVTGTCTDETATEHYTCLKSGHQWYSLDISGHVFLLTYYICVLTEECAAIKAEVWNLHYIVLFQEDKVTNWLVKLLELLATVEIILMTMMLCATAFCFHTFVEKLLGYVFGLASWYLTYRWLYGKFWKKIETGRDDKPIQVLSPSDALQPTANWQYQVLSRKSADVATALAANRLAERLASQLKAKEIIGQHVFEQATNYAPDVTEYTRVEHLITAVLTKTKCNPQCYHDFIKVLELDSIRPDTEAACSLLPKAATATITNSSGREAAPDLPAPTAVSKKLINDPEQVMEEALKRLVATQPGLQLLPGPRVVYRTDTHALATEDKVTLLSGGGSGHEPAHAGYVGRGMLTAAVAGAIFAPPPPESILAALMAIRSPAGTLMIVKKHKGDRIDFSIALERAKSEEIRVAMVLVGDDCALKNTGKLADRRGLCGTILVHKIAGAMAEQGCRLDEITATAEDVANSMGTMCVSYENDEIVYGVGIYGEAGVERTKLQPADAVVERMLEYIFSEEPGYQYFKCTPGMEVALVVNNLGGTSIQELNIMANGAIMYLVDKKQMKVTRVYMGTLMTSSKMRGVSLTLLKIKGKWTEYLDFATTAAAWLNASVVHGDKMRVDQAPRPCIAVLEEGSPPEAPFEIPPLSSHPKY